MVTISPENLKKAVSYCALIVIVFYLLAPFYWLVISSLKTHLETVTVPPTYIPVNLTWENFEGILLGKITGSSQARGTYPEAAHRFPDALVNSTLTALGVTAVCVMCGILAAYSISRIRPRGKDLALMVFLSARVVPYVTLAIPLYILVRALGLLDNILALILVYSAQALPFVVWVLTSYFETIPQDLEDAALVDGCTRLGALLKVILPVSWPATAASAIFSFMGSWGGFFFAVILTSRNAITVPPLIAQFVSMIDIEFGLINAAGVIAVIPPVILALVFNRFIVSGLIRGAIK